MQSPTLSRYFMTAALIGGAFAAQACSDRATAETKAGADKVLEATKKAGDKAAAAADVVGDKVVEKSKEAATAAGGEITDSWITMKIKAKFSDETALEGSALSVETTDFVVTLKGTVRTSASRTRAVDIARGTERVRRVVNQIAVK
jgi:osmotically-inducible protein OsmY